MAFFLFRPFVKAAEAVGTLFQDNKPEQPQMDVTPPSPDEADTATEEERKRRRLNAQGRAATILTGPQGVQGEVSARKTLTGI